MYHLRNCIKVANVSKALRSFLRLGAAMAITMLSVDAFAAACPYAKAQISVYRYPSGTETYLLCPTVLQYTAPIHYAAGSPPATAMPWDRVWELPDGVDDTIGPLASIPPCAGSSLFVGGLAALVGVEVCVTRFRYLPPLVTYEGVLRAEGIFRGGFESQGTLFSNGFEVW